MTKQPNQKSHHGKTQKNQFETIWSDPKFDLKKLEQLKLGDKFIMGDLGYREYLVSWVSDMIDKASTLEPLNILDLGCGNMRLGRALNKRRLNAKKYNYIGIDKIDFTQELSTASCLFTQYDVMKFEKILGRQDKDLIVCAGLIAYLKKSDIFSLFKKTFRVLKPGGIMIFNLPHPDLHKPKNANNQSDPTWMRVIPKISDGFLYEMQHFDSLGNSFIANIQRLDLELLNKFLESIGFKVLKVEEYKNLLKAFYKNQHLQSLNEDELKRLADQNAHIVYFLEKM